MRREIPGFPTYQVDEDGSVWSVGFANGREKKLKPGHSDNGYLIVRLAESVGKYRTCLVHLLVCEVFVGPRPSPLYESRHLDGNPLNCRADNLIWGTASENQLDRRHHGTSPQGMRHPKALINDSDVVEIRKMLAAGDRIIDIAAKFDVTRYVVNDIKRGKSWKHIK